jgi:hypothetical protein
LKNESLNLEPATQTDPSDSDSEAASRFGPTVQLYNADTSFGRGVVVAILGDPGSFYETSYIETII